LKLGLALSGGGSRAAAFHRGTVRALAEVGLLDELDVISSVSGGSVFAAAWMAAKWQGRTAEQFLDDMAGELARGFVARAVNWRLFKLLLPSYTRSNLLAEIFDRSLMHGMKLRDLPERPALCINTSVLNSGQVGRFSREGFSSTGIGPAGAPRSSNPICPIDDFPVSVSAAASAAFPIGLPPIYLQIEKHIPKGWCNALASGTKRLALTDGGVLENLGIQTLIKSRRFGAWDIILSDAGRKDAGWAPGGFRNSLRGLCMGLLSLPIIERVTTLMSDKQDRHMRLAAFGEIERSMLATALGSGARTNGINWLVSMQLGLQRRRILFVRLNQRLEDLIASIPHWQLADLAERSGRPVPRILKPATLGELGVDIDVALKIHLKLGGDRRIDELNQITTGFAKLKTDDIRDLTLHAQWQVHALKAIYWN
jgi:predicted acylesterase/phospholipase RssA